jgi:hypothetical protein
MQKVGTSRRRDSSAVAVTLPQPLNGFLELLHEWSAFYFEARQKCTVRPLHYRVKLAPLRGVVNAWQRRDYPDPHRHD